jgi:peptidoglycan/LPS O-acetylase OafA/YrhL
MTERPTLSRNLALDGLRGLSIIVVILYHSGVVSGGWIGVEVFFVLSGYLITTLLLLELDGTGRIDVVAFWKRRARRLLPGIGLLLVLIGLYTAWFSERTSSTIDLDIFGVLTYTSNWTTIAGDGYWATFATPSPLRHMWSLAVEEQFYLVFPLLALWLLLPRRRRWAVPTLTTAALAWQVAATSFFDINRVYLGTDTRAFGLLAGATAAVALHETRSRRANTGPGTQRWQPMAGLAAIVVLAVGVVVLSEDTDGLFRGPFQLVVCAAVALTTVIADRDRSGWLGHALSAGPLVHIGRWSYGIYLFHWPILIALEPGTPKQPWLLALAVSALAIPLAALSFRWIEVPIMRTGLRAFKPQSIGWDLRGVDSDRRAADGRGDRRFGGKPRPLGSRRHRRSNADR